MARFPAYGVRFMALATIAFVMLLCGGGVVDAAVGIDAGPCAGGHCGEQLTCAPVTVSPILDPLVILAGTTPPVVGMPVPPASKRLTISAEPLGDPQAVHGPVSPRSPPDFS